MSASVRGYETALPFTLPRSCLYASIRRTRIGCGTWILAAAARRATPRLGVDRVNKVFITLDEQPLIELHEVLLDESPAAALEFVKRHIAPKVPRKGTAPCDSSRLNPFILRHKHGRARPR